MLVAVEALSGAKLLESIGHGAAGGLEVHEVERDRAVEHGAAVVVEAGLGLHVVVVGEGAEVVGGGLDLRVAHAVADEQEHVLGALSSSEARALTWGLYSSGILGGSGGVGRLAAAGEETERHARR